MSITIRNLYKKYDDFFALNDVTMEIDKGIFGLLGKNGAGKTTLMRILVTLLESDGGEVTINKVPVDKKHVSEIKSMIGYLPQETGYYPNMTVYEFLTYMALMQEMSPNVYKERIDYLLEQVNLKEQRKKKVKNLSGGMKRRLGLAQAMINFPDVLIIDEPTTGLDPEERVRMRNMLSQFAKGRTIILSTHIVEDVAAIAHKTGILHEGKLKYIGDLETLIAPIQDKIYTITCKDEDEVKNLVGDYTPITQTWLNNGVIVRFMSENPEVECRKEIATIEDAFIYATKSSGEMQ